MTTASSRLVDPRTKIIALLAINVLVMGPGPFSLTLTCALLLLLPLSTLGTPRAVLTWAIWTGLWAGLYLALPLLWHGWAPTIVAALGFWMTRFSVGFACAWYVIASTRVNELVAAFRCPRAAIIPLAVMLRFVPALAIEFRAIIDAMRLRGIATSPLRLLAHPAQCAEYILVPLLASATRMADELSASAILRGLGKDGQRTSIVRIGYTWADAAVGLVLVAVCALRWAQWEVLQ
ncbi:energy-coupling factor transporter transmembrane component T [Schaalia suimastitidis]|uniref:energy-coupling factor transporter transmembrane component T n=1 Tax=Schaalia suimastitidis TaxID=121163 RepID=UPI0003F631DA|nr:energy-coupling factor transporter transmembrane component T [Schaalia suimastitidis]